MARKYLNNYEAQITTATVGAVDLSFDVDNPPPTLSAGDYYIMTLTDSLSAPTKVEVIKVIDVAGSTLTVERAQEDTTAQAWSAGDAVHLAATAGGFETLDGVTLKRFAETVAAATTTIDRADGGIKTLTLTADSALTWALNNGEKIQLYLTPAGFNITDWGVSYWMTDVPTLATENMIVVEKVGGSIYAWDGGSR